MTGQIIAYGLPGGIIVRRKITGEYHEKGRRLYSLQDPDDPKKKLLPGMADDIDKIFKQQRQQILPKKDAFNAKYKRMNR